MLGFKIVGAIMAILITMVVITVAFSFISAPSTSSVVAGVVMILALIWMYIQAGQRIYRTIKQKREERKNAKAKIYPIND